MARYRMIQTAFWTDTKILDVYAPEEKLLYLYLMTNPHTNLCGCYEISMSQMSSEIGYKKETVKKYLDRLQNVYRSVVYAETTSEILLVNWHKYNWTSSERFRKSLLNEIALVKDAEFKRYLMDLSEGIDTVSIPYTYGMDTSNSISNTIPNTVSDTDSKESKHKYGEYDNVLLTDKELEKLKTEFPLDWQKRIDTLSGYIKSKGAKYADHLATIRNWARREKQEPRKTGINNFEGRKMSQTDAAALERSLLGIEKGG